MRIPSLFLLICLLSACSAPIATTLPPTPLPATPSPSSTGMPDTPSGDWMGAATKPDGSIASIRVNFDDGILWIEPRTASWSIATTQSAESIDFSASGGTDAPFKEIRFVGTFNRATLIGELNWDGATSSVDFTRIASVDDSVFEKYQGIYRFESGRVLSILVSPEYSSGGLEFFSQTLMMTDFGSGALRGLYPLDDYTFAVGSLRVVGAPFAGRIQFTTDELGMGIGLMWWDDARSTTPSSTSGQYAERVPYKQEEITFTSADGIKLAGRLSLPETASGSPAFMMLHGSEPGMRDNFGNEVMAHYMISNGFAILNYDKRGVGDSEGTYREAASASNLQKHAEDAIAGVEYLASRPEIDPTRIGLIGISQAGWVIPIAAAQSNTVSHFVILSGPVSSTFQEDIFSSYTDDGESSRAYDDAEITEKLRELKPAGFDPLPVIAGLNRPGLWLWGSVDKNVPVTFSAENLQMLIDAGKGNFSYEIFPGGDHNLNASAHGLFAEIPYSPNVLFYSALAKWLGANMSKEQ